MNNILVIDTSSNKEIKIGLRIDNKPYWMRKKINKEKAQAILPLIDKILRKHKLTVGHVNAIEVNTGPGSFTGLRVGVAVANTLGWIFKVPVNGKKQLVTPRYL